MAVVHSEAKWGAHADGALHKSRVPVSTARSNRDIESPTLEISVELAEARGLLVVAVSTDQELRSVLTEVLSKSGVLFLDTAEQLLSRRMPSNCAVLIVEQSLSGSIFERSKSHLKESVPSLVTIMTGTGDNSSSLVSRLSAGHIDRFIVKPFKLGPTRSALRSALQQHRTLDQCAQVERSTKPEVPVVESAAKEKFSENRKSHSKAIEQSPSQQETPQSVPQLALQLTRSIAPVITPTNTTTMATSRRFALGPWGIALAAAIAAFAIVALYLIGKGTGAPVVALNPSSTFNIEKVIAGHLAAANRALELGSYVDPAELSAEHFYSAALELDPANAAARRGLDTVVDRLIADSKQRIGSGDLLRAQSTLDSVRRIQPNHPELADVTTSLLNAREAERVMLQAARIATKELAEPIQTASRVVAKVSASMEPNANKLLEERRHTIAHTNGPAIAPPVAPTIASVTAPTITPTISKTPTLKLDQAAAYSLERMKEERSSSSVAEAAMLVAPATTTRETNSTPIPVAKIEASPNPNSLLTSAVFKEPTLVKYVEPVYSEWERSVGNEGWVEVHFLVASDGRVIDPRFEKRSLSSGLRRATLKAVAQWRYSPTPGAPDRPMTVRVYFKLDDKKANFAGNLR